MAACRGVGGIEGRDAMWVADDVARERGCVASYVMWCPKTSEGGLS